MNSFVLSMVIVPGVVALLLVLLFTYLYEQSRQQYFRAWQLAWGFYTLHYALDAWGAANHPSIALSFLGWVLLVAMAICIYVSTRLMREKYRLRWDDIVLALAGIGLVWWTLHTQIVDGVFRPGGSVVRHLPLNVGIGVVLLYCSAYFYRHAHRKNSLAFTLLAVSLALWAVLMVFGELHDPFVIIFGSAGHFLGPIPQMLLGDRHGDGAL